MITNEAAKYLGTRNLRLNGLRVLPPAEALTIISADEILRRGRAAI
jgi:hypothetical protein